MDNRSVKDNLVHRIALGVFGLLVVAMLLLAVFNDKGMMQVRAQAKALSGLESDISRIEAENKALSDEIHALRTDPAKIEKLAREELRLVKPGEVVLVTPSDNATSAPPSQAPAR